MTSWVPVGCSPGDDGSTAAVAVTGAAAGQPGKVSLKVQDGHGSAVSVLDLAEARNTGFRLIYSSAAVLLGDPAPALPVLTDDAYHEEPYPDPGRIPDEPRSGHARPGDWPAFLREIRRLDHQHLTRSREGLPEHGVPFQPYPVPEFVALLIEAVMHATGRSFLEVGCGPGGTRMRLAEALFDLDVFGIDIVPGHVEKTNAGRMFRTAAVADARTWGGYSQFSIVYLNRPADGPEQDPLERHVTGTMRPGSILITVNGALDPGKTLGWKPVSVEEGRPAAAPVAGVWQKPSL